MFVYIGKGFIKNQIADGEYREKILGLDLGTASIGWAVANEAETSEEKSSIVKLGVRTISYDNFVSSEKRQRAKRLNWILTVEREFRPTPVGR